MSVENLISQLRDAAKFTLADTLYSLAADKLEELKNDLSIAQGNTDAAIEDYNNAINTLAEKDKKISALKYQNDVRQDLINELRNAGGTND